MTNLTERVNQIDLPGLIAKHYPDSGARPGTQDAIKAVWRGDKHPSASLYRSPDQGAWMMKDHATGEAMNAYQFMREIMNMNHEEVVDHLGGSTQPAAQPQPPQQKTISQKTVDEFLSYPEEPPKSLSGRGFTKADVSRYSIRNDNGDALLPIFSRSGELVTIKRKYLNSSLMKYSYEEHGITGFKAWHSPGGGHEVGPILVVEGELNAMIAHSVLLENNQAFDVIGMQGASNKLEIPQAHMRDVYIYADNDDAGDAAKAMWKDNVKAAGGTPYVLQSLEEVDFCDVAGASRVALYEWLTQEMERVDGTEEKVIAEHYTLTEVRANLQKLMDGQIEVPSGYHELDKYTRGLRVADINLICALPSMGKSIAIRDISLYHAHKLKNKVALISPDMDPESIWYFITSKLTGIPVSSVEDQHFTQDLYDQYGSKDGIIQAFEEAFEYVITDLSKRLLISEVPKVEDFEDRVMRWQDAGVELFVGDYIQTFEPMDTSGGAAERRVAMEFKTIARRHKATMLFATQLAKYKFPYGSERDPLPYASDIEGSGKIYQNAAQVWMIYNRVLYEREYVNGEDPPPWPVGHENDWNTVRMIVRKNKRRGFGDYRRLGWNKPLVTFYDLSDPRKGVLA